MTVLFQQPHTSYFLKGIGVALMLTMLVIVLGAYTRLSDAGLGCPDWPGCYGQLLGVPEQPAEIAKAEQAYPGWRVEVDKAWIEMVHRYFAGGLGLIILMLTAFAFIVAKQRRGLMLSLLGLVTFQALLGMWTVTLLLQPLVVVAHLLGGFTVLALLWWLYLDRWFEPKRATVHNKAFYRITLVALVLLVMQITLGGWTSSNYAALACVDFPLCQGQWIPEADYRGGFRFLVDERNYEYGVLDSPQRTAIHFSHRLGALIVVVFFVVFLAKLFMQGSVLIRRVALGISALLVVQIMLGISNVVFSLPLTVAVLHNAIAALLLLSLLLLLRVLKS